MAGNKREETVWHYLGTCYYVQYNTRVGSSNVFCILWMDDWG